MDLGVGRWALEVDPLRLLPNSRHPLYGYEIGHGENVSDFRPRVVEIYYEKGGFGRWALVPIPQITP